MILEPPFTKRAVEAAVGRRMAGLTPIETGDPQGHPVWLTEVDGLGRVAMRDQGVIRPDGLIRGKDQIQFARHPAVSRSWLEQLLEEEEKLRLDGVSLPRRVRVNDRLTFLVRSSTGEGFHVVSMQEWIDAAKEPIRDTARKLRFIDSVASNMAMLHLPTLEVNPGPMDLADVYEYFDWPALQRHAVSLGGDIGVRVENVMGFVTELDRIMQSGGHHRFTARIGADSHGKNIVRQAGTDRPFFIDLYDRPRQPVLRSLDAASTLGWFHFEGFDDPVTHDKKAIELQLFDVYASRLRSSGADISDLVRTAFSDRVAFLGALLDNSREPSWVRQYGTDSVRSALDETESAARVVERQPESHGHRQVATTRIDVPKQLPPTTVSAREMGQGATAVPSAPPGEKLPAAGQTAASWAYLLQANRAAAHLAKRERGRGSEIVSSESEHGAPARGAVSTGDQPQKPGRVLSQPPLSRVDRQSPQGRLVVEGGGAPPVDAERHLQSAEDEPARRPMPGSPALRLEGPVSATPSPPEPGVTSQPSLPSVPTVAEGAATHKAIREVPGISR